jgi:hypothetical protein
LEDYLEVGVGVAVAVGLDCEGRGGVYGYGSAGEDLLVEG